MLKLPFPPSAAVPVNYFGTTFKLARGDKALKIDLPGTVKLCMFAGSKKTHRTDQAYQNRQVKAEQRWKGKGTGKGKGKGKGKAKTRGDGE